MNRDPPIMAIGQHKYAYENEDSYFIVPFMFLTGHNRPFGIQNIYRFYVKHGNEVIGLFNY